MCWNVAHEIYTCVEPVTSLAEEILVYALCLAHQLRQEIPEPVRYCYPISSIGFLLNLFQTLLVVV